MSRMVWILAVLLSHWRRHPMQLATLLIGLISATALWSGVQALNLGIRCVLDPGDEAIVLTPAWPNGSSSIMMANSMPLTLW